MDGRPSIDEPIGGFFGLEPPGTAPDAGLAALWGVRETPHAWSNAGSALAALVRHLRPGAVWLPGHWCPWTPEAVPERLRRFYPLGADLSPREGAVHPDPGDLVLAADMFGRAPGRSWRDLVAAHPGATFVEDRAQALDTGTPAWGDWLLYSPRKLCGLWEGGLLVPGSERGRAQVSDLPPPGSAPDPEAVLSRLAPVLMRAEAPARSDLWHPLQRAAEAAQGIEDIAMSAAARAHLAVLDGAGMAARRRANFAQLHAELGAYAMIDDPAPDFAPMGFPLRLGAARDRLRDRLHGAGIFAATHWPSIPGSDPGDLARAAGSLTLPCDHRYGPAEMARVAETVREILS